MHTYTPTSSREVEAHESKQCAEWCTGGGGVRSPLPGLKTQTLANNLTGMDLLIAHLCAVDTFIQVASANQERFSLSSALTPATGAECFQEGGKLYL